MRLYFNIESLTRRSGGIGKYTFHLVKEVLASGMAETVLGFDGKHWRKLDADTFANLSVSDIAREPGIVRMLARHVPGAKSLHEFAVGRRFNRGGSVGAGAIYHETDFIVKPFQGRKVATIHDLSFLRYPQFQPSSRVSYFRRNLPFTIKTVDHIITDARCVREELLSSFGVAAEKVTAIPLGVDGDFSPNAGENSGPVLARYGLNEGRYLLSVATLEPRKNLANVVRAHARLSPELRREYPLVLAGCEGWMNSSLVREMEPAVQAGDIRVLGYVPESDLPTLYAASRAAVFVPVYEGFGLPALEALACGVPLLASDIPPLREVVGENGVFVPHRDVEAIEQGLTQVLTDNELRQRLQSAGPERASAFTWQRCASETMAIYRRLAG